MATVEMATVEMATVTKRASTAHGRLRWPKTSLVAAVAVAATLTLAACGDDSAGAAGTTAKGATATVKAASGATTSFDLASLTTGKATEAGKKFCEAMAKFDSLDTNGSDLAATKKNLNAMADAIKANAPAEIKKAATSYADFLKAVASNSKDAATLGAEMAKGQAANAQDFATFIAYLTTNCQ